MNHFGSRTVQALEKEVGLVTYSLPTNMLYITDSFVFKATGSSTTLSSAGADASFFGSGPVIGNVTVNPVPLPPTVLLFGPGLAGFIGLSRRFKK